MLQIERFVLAGLALLAVSSAAVAEDLRPFEARYEVHWKGMTAGHAALELKRGPADTWTYTSNSRARGLFRVALPGSISQTSEFRIVDDTVQPQRYVGDDGTRDTSRDVDVKFDWEAGRVRGVFEEQMLDMAVPPGTLDDLSVQVALMYELLRGRAPMSFHLIGKDAVRDFDYTREQSGKLATAIGEHETIQFRSRRHGSRGSTVFWCAPDLGYLPVRVERHGSKGQVEWSMQIQSARRD